MRSLVKQSLDVTDSTKVSCIKIMPWMAYNVENMACHLANVITAQLLSGQLVSDKALLG